MKVKSLALALVLALLVGGVAWAATYKVFACVDETGQWFYVFGRGEPAAENWVNYATLETAGIDENIRTIRAGDWFPITRRSFEYVHRELCR